MLDEARRRHERGEDVIVGAVQGQQSEEVKALLQKLESIPSLQSEDDRSLDLDAILRRAPQVCRATGASGRGATFQFTLPATVAAHA